jgi:hypothetical protein
MHIRNLQPRFYGSIYLERIGFCRFWSHEEGSKCRIYRRAKSAKIQILVPSVWRHFETARQEIFLENSASKGYRKRLCWKLSHAKDKDFTPLAPRLFLGLGLGNLCLNPWNLPQDLQFFDFWVLSNTWNFVEIRRALIIVVRVKKMKLLEETVALITAVEQ